MQSSAPYPDNQVWSTGEWWSKPDEEMDMGMDPQPDLVHTAAYWLLIRYLRVFYSR